MPHMFGRRVLAGLALVAFAGVDAGAQPARGSGPGAGYGGPGMMGGGGGGMMGGGMMGGSWNTDSYLTALKTQLDITPKQQPAWKEYSDTVSGVGVQMQGLHQTMFEAMGTASWEERRNLMNQMFQARQQAADTVHDAANKLLPALTPAQRTQARSILPGLAYGRGMMGSR